MALYRVRLQYGVTVSAPSQWEAHAKVAKMLRDNPEWAITGVEDASVAKSHGVLKRILLGK